MSKFTIKEFPFEGPKIIVPNNENEPRAYLVELEEQESYKQMGVEETFAQHTCEKFARGVLRGLHFQRKNPQGRFIAVTSGSALTVVVDLRPESKTFGASHAIELSAVNEQMIYVPQYFAHGFLTLEPQTEVVINYTNPYSEADDSRIIWDDEILAIDWRFDRYDIDQKRLNLSAKDRKSPSFRSYNQHDLWPGRVIKKSYALKRLLNTRTE